MNWNEMLAEEERLRDADLAYMKQHGIPAGFVLWHGKLYPIPVDAPEGGWVFIRGEFMPQAWYPREDDDWYHRNPPGFHRV